MPSIPEHNDHDLLIQLNTKVDALIQLKDKVDSLLDLRPKFDSILDRLNGHVPEKCIRHDDRLTHLESDISSIAQDVAAYKAEHSDEHKKLRDDSTQTARWNWSTVLAAAAICLSIVTLVKEWIAH